MNVVLSLFAFLNCSSHWAPFQFQMASLAFPHQLGFIEELIQAYLIFWHYEILQMTLFFKTHGLLFILCPNEQMSSSSLLS